MTAAVSLTAAFLAEYASAGTAVLNVIGGAINTLGRQFFPAPIRAHLVCLVGVTDQYDGRPVPASIVVRSTENEDVYARLDGANTFGTIEKGQVPAQVPFIVDITEVYLPRAGKFAVDVTVAGQSRCVEFQVTAPPPEAFQSVPATSSSETVLSNSATAETSSTTDS